MRFAAVRKYALSLADVTEEPHHDAGSFRVHGRIFATVPPGLEVLHVFVPEQQREVALALHPEFVEKLLWGGRVVGVRISLPAAKVATVRELVRQAWEHKARKLCGRTPRKRLMPTPAVPRLASQEIDAKLAELDDWRGETLRRVRTLIRDADPDIVEEVKWRKPSNPSGVPVWSHGGILCTGEIYRTHVRLTFARGGALDDPSGLFDPVTAGNVRRAIVLREGDGLDANAFKRLIRSAVGFAASGRKT